MDYYFFCQETELKIVAYQCKKELMDVHVAYTLRYIMAKRYCSYCKTATRIDMRVWLVLFVVSTDLFGVKNVGFEILINSQGLLTYELLAIGASFVIQLGSLLMPVLLHGCTYMLNSCLRIMLYGKEGSLLEF